MNYSKLNEIFDKECVSLESRIDILNFIHDEYIKGFKHAVHNIEQKTTKHFCLCGNVISPEEEHCMSCLYSMENEIAFEKDFIDPKDVKKQLFAENGINVKRQEDIQNIKNKF